MRLSSSLSSTARVSQKLWLLFAAAAYVGAKNFTPIAQPTLKLNSLGRVGLVGDFDAISLYEFKEQNETAAFSNGTQNLLTTLPNGLFTSLDTSDAEISAMCYYVLQDGTQKGIMVGGNFTKLGNVGAKGIALFDPDSGQVTALPGFNGKVNALACDKDTGRVYVGGSFNINNSSNAIAYENGKWVSLPFEGFSDPVQTIAMSNNDTIIFGGSFSSVTNSTNRTTIRNSQTLNIGSAQITATQTTTSLSGFDDPTALTCSNTTSKQWLLNDQTQGSWTANFSFGFTPTKLRLTNANHDGRGTSLFRFTKYPATSIMNLTYIDNGHRKYCDANCPLLQTDEPQDFEFVNVIEMGMFRIDILNWYGNGAGLSGVEIFQDAISAYAMPNLNEPSCVASDSKSSSSVTGAWQTKTDNVEGILNGYLSTNIATANISSVGVVFTPHIQQSGKYRVLVHTPGCLQDGTCSTRGKVNYFGLFTKGGQNSSAFESTQTNDHEKIEEIYYGMVDATDSSFKPTVTLQPITAQTADTVNIAAWKVDFLPMDLNGTSSIDGSEGEILNSTNSVEINGLYEYYTKENGPTDPAGSAISTAGLNLTKGAAVNALVVQDKTTFVGGNFTAKDGSFTNFFSIDSNGLIKPNEGGLNGIINSMMIVDNLIYVGGSFNATKSKSTTGLGFVATYDTQSKSWGSLGAGVNGTVNEIVSLSLNLTTGVTSAIAVSGSFGEINADSSNKNVVAANGFAVWIPSQKSWLARMTSEGIALEGTLTASVTSGNTTIYAGNMNSNQMSASGLVYLSAVAANTLQASNLDFVTPSTSSKNKRDVTEVAQNFSGIYVGAFYNTDGYNLTILGGHFSAAGNTSTVSNLAFIDGDNNNAVTGINSEIDSNSTILALQRIDSLLYAGGKLQSSSGLSGVMVWDFAAQKLAADQPPGLQGKNVTVRSITNRPSSNQIFVGGTFDSAGSLSCPSLCVFDNKVKQWDIPGGSITGDIYVTHWVDTDHLIVGGDMMINGSTSYIALFNAKVSSWGSIGGNMADIPGRISSVSMDSEYSSSLFVAGQDKDGKPFLSKLQDNKFTSISTGFSDSSVIRNIQVLDVVAKHATSDLIDSGRVLLVTGSLSNSDVGDFSAATWDGSSWTPFILSSKFDGKPGSMASFVSEIEPTFTNGGKKLAKGLVILISLAIALALVFLIVALGVLASYLRRRQEGYVPAPTFAGAEKSTAMQDRIPPQDLFGGQNAGRPGAPMI